MAVDLTGAFEVTRKELEGYALWIGSAYASPSFLATEALRWSDTRQERRAKRGTRADASFMSVLIISALIGATLGALIPGRPPLPERATAAVVVIALWYFTSRVFHSVVRLFGGKAPAAITVRVMMQVLALAYVASNFAVLIVSSTAAIVPAVFRARESLGLSPGLQIVSVQAIVIMLYLPMSIKVAHGVRGVITVVVLSVIAAALAVGLAAGLSAVGTC